jgi:hypothetical protein
MRKFGRVVCGLAIAYVLVYSVLSAFGHYEPALVDLRGVRLYEWAPLGFYDSDHPWPNSLTAIHSPTQKTGGWSTSMEVTFLPLWILDARLIHARKWA